ncbi:3-oxoacyl-ACP reductase [Mesorhizobium loti]|nr:SDR family oxidoreductase [Mesorhizobium loti]PLP57469.1 3-oxoacyl-ACP reductase [Mesorhizobium loti]
MDLGIRGKKAIVCASSKGLGRGCAIALAEAGCDLVVNGRDPALLAKTAAEIRERFGVRVVEVVGDVSKPEVQKALIDACPDPDILVNNNGGPPYRDFRELDREKILEGVTNNMVTPIELVKAVIDGMATRGFGRIVNITSLSVYMPIPGLDLSSGARAGLTSFLAGVARTVIDRNVTINSLLPGKLDTDRLRGPHEPGSVETPEAATARRARLAADIPARRLGTPEEFGQVCAFLCSVHAGYLTGQNIPIDGGLYVSAF